MYKLRIPILVDNKALDPIYSYPKQRIGDHLVCRGSPDQISARLYLTGSGKCAFPLLALLPKGQPSTRLEYEYLNNACLEPWKYREEKHACCSSMQLTAWPDLDIAVDQNQTSTTEDIQTVSHPS